MNLFVALVLALLSISAAAQTSFQPLRTPEHVTRKSFALYYYTREPALDDAEDRPTNWQSVGETH